MIEHGNKGFGLSSLAQHGKAPKVAHQNRDASPASAHLHAFRRIQYLSDYVIRQIPAEGLRDQLIADLQFGIECPDLAHGFHGITQIK